jgi:hypothetical protein
MIGTNRGNGKWEMEMEMEIEIENRSPLFTVHRNKK